MTNYLSPNAVIGINAAHGGEGAGIRNRGGIEAAVARPYAGFGGHEEYDTIWRKAGVLLHGLASTQNFFDGNKRTAWIAAVEFLRLNDKPLRDLPVATREAFVLAVATNLIDERKAAEWFEENRLRAKDRYHFAFIAAAAELQEDDATFSADHAMIAHFISDGYPVTTDLQVVAHVRWHAVDAGVERELRLYAEDPAGPVQFLHPPEEISYRLAAGELLENLGEIEFLDHVSMRFIPVTTGSQHHPSGVIPHLVQFNTGLVMHGPGPAWLRIDLDGDEFARLPIDLHLGPGFE